MSSEWKQTIRLLLGPIETTINPFEIIDQVVKSLTGDSGRSRIPQYIKDIEHALAQREQISFLITQPHSEELVRDYLYDILGELKKLKIESPKPPPTAEAAAAATPQKKKEQMLIAVDFDGTIVEHQFPEIGPPLPDAIDTLKALQSAGHRLILFTCREDEMDSTGRKYLTEAVEYCREKGVYFVSANETLSNDDFRPQGGRKVYADVYIDDRNLGGFPGWAKIKKMLL